MRLSRIELKNYRQFKEVELFFPKKGTNDIQLFIAKNGTGKTNLLNAVNWCLYGDEPHISSKYKGLEVPNLASIDELRDGGDISVLVELDIDLNLKSRLTFSRESIYRIHKNKTPTFQSTKFKVRFPDIKGNTKIVEGDEANIYVNRFVPQVIREFFFFDGERLDSYFREESGLRISKTVFEIAQIALLGAVERKLSELIKEIEKEAGKKSPTIKSIRDLRDSAEKKQGELKGRTEECEKQLYLAEQKCSEYTEKLRALPDVDALEDERSDIILDTNNLQERIKEKNDERGDILFEYGVIISSLPALKNLLDSIDQKRSEGKIPPTIEPGILMESLKKGRCVISQRELESICKEKMSQLLKDIELSSKTAIELQRVEGPLHMLLNKSNGFDKQIRKVNKELDAFLTQLKKLQSKKEEIDKQLSGYSTGKVKAWAKSRREFEEQMKILREKKGALSAELEGATKELDEISERLKNEIRAEKEVEEFRKQIAFCSKAYSIIKEAKQTIMNEVRQQIEKETNKRFMDLIWKKKTYENVEIDDNYIISLYHKMGYNALGTASAAERELLALSFTLALHKISGFDAPLMIDTPVARVSDEHRENFSKVLSQVGSSEKQVLLLFTPDEYTASVSKWLEEKAASRRELRLQNNEKETVVKDLNHA